MEKKRLQRLAGAGWIAVLLLLLALPALPETLDPKSIRETVFPSGLRLIVKEAHGANLAAVQVWVRAGSFLEDEKTSGFAHVIEHLVFKGSEAQGPGTVDQTIEDLGAELSAMTEKDWTMFGTTVAAPHALKVIDVMGEAIRNPRLRAQDYAAEKRLILEEIAGGRFDPERVATAALFDMAFDRHPYRLEARGAPEVVNDLNMDALRAYFRKYYVPANMAVVVVGDVSPAAVEARVRAAFAAGTPGSAAPPVTLPPPEQACSRPRREVLEMPFRGGFVGLALPAPGVNDQPDVYAMDILVTMLEHGAFGRLPAALRGKAAAVRATYTTRRQPGLLTILAVADPARLEAVEQAIRDELQKLVDQPPTEQEIDFTRRQLAGDYALDNETFSGQASSLGFYFAIDRWQFATTYLDRIRQTTPAEVAAVAKKYLAPARACAVILKPAPPPGGAPPGGAPPGAPGRVQP